MSAFQRVLDRLCELVPTLETRPHEMVKACNEINVWLQSGCDVDLDILPAINRKWVHTPTGVKVFSAHYFSAFVMTAREKRLQTDDHKKREAEMLAQGYAWKRARGLPLSSDKIRFLERYEAEHGPISVAEPA